MHLHLNVHVTGCQLKHSTLYYTIYWSWPHFKVFTATVFPLCTENPVTVSTWTWKMSISCHKTACQSSQCFSEFAKGRVGAQPRCEVALCFHTPQGEISLTDSLSANMRVFVPPPLSQDTFMHIHPPNLLTAKASWHKMSVCAIWSRHAKKKTENLAGWWCVMRKYTVSVEDVFGNHLLKRCSLLGEKRLRSAPAAVWVIMRAQVSVHSAKLTFCNCYSTSCCGGEKPFQIASHIVSMLWLASKTEL